MVSAVVRHKEQPVADCRERTGIRAFLSLFVVRSVVVVRQNILDEARPGLCAVALPQLVAMNSIIGPEIEHAVDLGQLRDRLEAPARLELIERREQVSAGIRAVAPPKP